MGEDIVPQEDMENDSTSDKDESLDDEMEEDDDDLEEMSPEEFQAIDNQLDALNSALDDIEEKNDNIYARLLQLLESNKAIRQQMQSNQSQLSDISMP